MKIAFLGGLYPQELYNKIQSKSKRSFQMAANNLQWAFVNGLDAHFENFTILTVPFISTFPFGYRDLYFKGGGFSHNIVASDICLSFINIPILKDWSIKRNLTNELRKWCRFDDGKKCIIIYSLQANIMKAAIEIKDEFPNLTICQIVADLPEYMGVNPIYKKLGLQKKSIETIKKCIKKIDCFVILSEYMKDKLNIKNKPYVRIEGMFQNNLNNLQYNKEIKKTILYTGSLSNKYGIEGLLNAFSLIKDSDYRLWICGDGDMKDKITEKALIDDRVKYLGILSFDEVKILQKKATVLINPRTSEGEYTKYSFPSKTMEYLASGTPTIMNKLPSIPDEYYQFAFVTKDESIKQLKQSIIEACSKSQEELNQFGEKASQFILINKNPKSQVGKILEMIKRL